MIKKYSKSILIHSFLILISFLSLFPFLWLISTALKGINENIFQYPPSFLPKFPTFDNFIGVWKQIPFLLLWVAAAPHQTGNIVLRFVHTYINLVVFTGSCCI